MRICAHDGVPNGFAGMLHDETMKLHDRVRNKSIWAHGICSYVDGYMMG